MMTATAIATAMSAVALASNADRAQAHGQLSREDVAEIIRSYDIPAGLVSTALNTVADQAGVRIVYDSRLTGAQRTKGFSGRRSLAEALGRLLAGTGLSYELSPNGKSVLVVLAQADTARSDGAEALPPIDIGAAQAPRPPKPGPFGGKGLAQDPHDTSYVLPDASTGTKTDTPVMDTPLNVQSVAQQVMKDQHAVTLSQALRNISGVDVPNGSVNGKGTPGARITSRGFPTSTTYRDGFRRDDTDLTADQMSFLQLANVASVEVLKGPGAILYGLSEPGGVVNLVTKQPLATPYYAIEQQFGSFDNYRTTIDATGPVADDGSLLYRMNFAYQRNGAPYGPKVDLIRGETLFLAPVLEWSIDNATKIKFEVEYNENHLPSFFSDTPVINDAFVKIPSSRFYGESVDSTFQTLFAAVSWKHDFDEDWSIKHQVAFEQLQHFLPLTWPWDTTEERGGLAVLRADQNYYQRHLTYSTNVDLTGHFDTFGAKHTLLVGGDFYRLISDQSYSYSVGTSLIDIFDPVHPGVARLPDSAFAGASLSKQDTSGVYVQDQIELPFKVFAMAGGRYQYIRQSNLTGDTPGSLNIDAHPSVARAVTPRFGLLWRPQEWISFYGNYAESFGANSGLMFPGIPVPPTSARSWEAGFKLELLDERLRVTADYYDLTKTNVATADLRPGFANFVTVTGAARSHGVEVDVQGTLLPGWNVIAAYTHRDVRVTSGSGSTFGLVTEGQRYPDTPSDLASLWTTYEFQHDVLEGVKIGAGYTYHGAQTYLDMWNLYNTPSTMSFPTLPSYGVVDLMAAYSFKFADSKLTAQINVNNLFDRRYYTGALVLAPGATPYAAMGRLSYGAPLTLLGTIRAEF